jgi:hypothetical protein
MHASKQKSELPRLGGELLLKQQLPDELVCKFLADLCTLAGQYRDAGGCISEAKLLSLAVLLRPLSLQERFLSRAPVFLAFPPLLPLPTPPPIDRSQPASQAGGRGRCPLVYGQYRFAFSSSSSSLTSSVAIDTQDAWG